MVCAVVPGQSPAREVMMTCPVPSAGTMPSRVPGSALSNTTIHRYGARSSQFRSARAPASASWSPGVPVSRSYSPAIAASSTGRSSAVNHHARSASPAS